MSAANESALLAQNAQGLQLVSKLMLDATPEDIKSLFPVVVDVVARKSITPGIYNSKNMKESTERYKRLLGGLLTLVNKLLREKSDTVKETDLRQLLKSLKMNDDCSNCFISAFLERKEYLYGVKMFQHYPNLRKLDWRVDITISSSALNKCVNTVIIMQIQLSNGEMRSFEISIAKFHMLRLYVASLLKEIINKEKTK